ncbi:MAG: glycosyltransferase [Trueperaceae bacterium]|nr:glycosyltransferase [Trueperaceae bacterium]
MTRSYDMTNRARRAAQTTERIVASTERLLADGPLGDVTLPAIAEGAGVTVQTVLRHMGSRDGCLHAVGERVERRVEAQRQATRPGDVEGAISSLVAHYEAEGRLVPNLLAQEHGGEPVARDGVQRGRSYHRDWVTRAFGLAGRRGRTPARRRAGGGDRPVRLEAAAPRRGALTAGDRGHDDSPGERRPGRRGVGRRPIERTPIGGTTMSTILMYTSPARGHLYPMMDVALAMRDAGHRVVVQTLASERDRVTAEGLEHRPIAPEIEALTLDDYRQGNPMQQLRAAFDCWLTRAPHEVDDLQAARSELDPELVLVDANTWGAAAAAEAEADRTGRAWSMFLPYALPVPSPTTPAFGPGFPPPKGGVDRLRDRLVWAVMNGSLRGPVTKLQRLRAELGAPPLDGYSDLFVRADVLLYRTAEPFEYPRQGWPRGVHAIGPGLWAPPGEAPDWLATLPRPRVLVSVSTELQEDGMIIATALEALADEPGSVVVTSAALDPDRFEPPHDRTRIVRFLPHASVIPEMDLVVTHGGMGTTQRALAAGVPVCVVPWGRDQSESARRAEVAGAGTMVARRRLTVARLRAAMREARSRRAGAQRVAQGFRDAGGARRAVQLLEGLLNGDGSKTARA